MAYLQFDYTDSTNFDATLQKEFIETNASGSYMHTTINGCNISKYNGLLVVPIKNFNGEKHVLLSSLDPTVVKSKKQYHLAAHRFRGGNHLPQIDLPITNFNFDKIATTTYQADGIKLIKEQILDSKKDVAYIKYTLEDADDAIKIQLKPFLAFRNMHDLSKNNDYVQKKYQEVENGISLCLYDNYPNLFMQLSKKAEFVPAPDWYYDVEYVKEFERGYECLEDLYVPGYFEVELQKGESVIFSAATEEMATVSLEQFFAEKVNKKAQKDSFINTLKSTAHQFVIKKENCTDLIAGYPWHKSITRQTFIALPGISLATNDVKLYEKVLDTYCEHLNNGFSPDSIEDKQPTYNNADVSLWFIWAVQEYSKAIVQPKKVWERYGEKIQQILTAYKDGASEIIKMNPNGLIYAHKPDTPLTWMDASIHGKAVFQRSGYAIEINALWYNAICFAIELAKQNKDKKFAKEWSPIKEKTSQAFNTVFSDEKHDHIADFADGNHTDWSIRPNMIIATALDYTPLSKKKKKETVAIARDKLLTKRGVRTLSPDHLRYKGHLTGNHFERENVLFLGAAHPWLLRFFTESYLKVHGYKGLLFIKQLLQSFEEELKQNCLATFSEMYDGSQPHEARGATSQVWNVANITYIAELVRTMENKKRSIK